MPNHEVESPPRRRLLDLLRDGPTQTLQLPNEQSYVHWVRRFVFFHGKRHPRDMGADEVTAFLTILRGCARFPPRLRIKALAALLFLYGEVLG